MSSPFSRAARQPDGTTDASGGAPSEVSRATHQRWAVSTLFLLMGGTMGSWAARIPGVRGQVGLNDAHWGLVILASPVGTLITLLVLTRFISRSGARRLAIPAAVVLLCTVPVTASSSSVFVLVASLFLQGMASGMLSTSMNALAVAVERAIRRRIMSSFHACFSLGQLAGGGLGVLAASAGVSPGLQIGVTSGVLAGALLATVRWLPKDHPGAPDAPEIPAAPIGADESGSRPGISPQLMLLSAIALLSSVNEGGAVQWSAQYAAVTVGGGAGLGALTFSCFSVAMTTSRFLGDRLVERLGRGLFIRVSALTAAAGMALALGVGTSWAAFVGYLLVGAGSGCLVPTVIGLAGNQPGIPTGRGVAIVSFGQWPAFLIGPPLIGGLAGLVGLRSALGVTVLAALIVAVLSRWLREPERIPEDRAVVVSRADEPDPR